ncbi:MAG TPA: hypothetical protein VJ850_10210 [Candidatus Limnocylindrales bacterium]|nr:hypothetical protein [Candidatus Limnocylindrales bacterium]
MTADSGGAESATCPWCSATVPVAATTCPSCGAALRDSADGDIAGVTQLDPTAMLRTKRVKPRGIAAWLVGEREQEVDSGGKVEPPSDAVRQEMRRLELAAIEAELDAKTAAAAANRELGIDAEAPASADLDAPTIPAGTDAPGPADAADPSAGQDQPA